MNEDVVYLKWLAAGAPGGKPDTRRFAGRVLSGAIQIRQGKLQAHNRHAREDFAALRRGTGRRIRDDGSYSEPWPVELVLVDPVEARRFRTWIARDCPGAGLETQLLARRLRTGDPPPDENAVRLRDAWRQLRSFVRSDGTFNATAFRGYGQPAGRRR